MVAIYSNYLRVFKSVNLSGINYDSKSSDPALFNIKQYSESKNAQIKEVEISFDMNANSISNFNNVFQTGPANSGIRMELGGSSGESFTMVIGEKYGRVKGVVVSNHFNPGEWHSVKVCVSKDKKIEISLDGNTVVSGVYDSIDYVISDIAIGTGFSKTRPFDGQIKDFSIRYKYFDKVLPNSVLLMIKLLLFICFMFSAIKLRKEIVEAFRFLSKPIIMAISGIKARIMQSGFNKVLMPLLFLIIPFLLVAFSVFKIYSDPYFINAIHPNTLKCLALFLLGIIVVMVFLNREFKNGFLVILLSPLLIILAGKYLALIGLFTFMLACLSLGLTLYGFFSHGEMDTKKISFACLFGLAANSYLIWVAIHFKVNYPIVYYLFFGSQIFLLRRTLIINFRAVKNKMLTYNFTLPQKVLAVLMIVQVVYVLVPNYSSDELVAHFYVPKIVWLNGVFNFNPHYSPAFFNLSYISLGSNSSLFLMGGEYAIKLFYWLILYIALFLLESFTRKKYGERISFFATLTLATTPYFLWQIGCNFIDSLELFSATVVFIHFSFLVDEFNKKNLMLYMLLACFAIMCKLQIIFLLIPTGLILFWMVLHKVFKDKEFSFGKVFLLGCVTVVLFLLPFLLHNWIITRNPIFPMYNDIFKSPYYETKTPLPGFSKFKGAKLQWDSLYDITFKGDKYVVGGNNQFLFGVSYFIFLLFLPLLLSCHKHKKQLLLTFLLFSASVLLCYIITGPQLRYFIASAPMGAILIGLIMNKLLVINSNSKMEHRILYSIFFSVFVINFICQINNGYLPSPYPVKEAITGDYADSPRLKYWEDRKNFFEELNKRYDRNTKALLYYTPPAMYFADFKIEVLDWYNQLTVMEIVRDCKNIEEIYERVFKKQRFDILIITDNRPATFLDDFILKGMVRKEYSSAGYNVYVPVK